MKMARRITTLLLALVMVLSVSATVFAKPIPPSFTVTITGTSEGHTFEAYQIFDGDLADDCTLSNVVWGTGVSEAGQIALGNAADRAAGLTDAASADTFAQEVAPYLTSPAATATVAQNSETCQLTGLEPGYYLIKTSVVPETNGVYSNYIMRIVYINTDLEILDKASFPIPFKFFDTGIENSTDAVTIGQTITFIIGAALPADLDAYSTYTLIFHDQFSKDHFEFLEVTNIMAYDVSAETEITLTDSGLSLEGSDAANGKLVMTLADVRALGLEGNDQLAIFYTAKVKPGVPISTPFNNTVYLQYSNDPYSDSLGTSHIEEVSIYTCEIPVFKYTGPVVKAPDALLPVDLDEPAAEVPTGLAGAGFTLYKDEACTQAFTVTKDASVTDRNLYRIDPNSTISEITTDDTGRFSIGGLGFGTYYLKETTTPSGYNTAEVVRISVFSHGIYSVNDPETGEEISVSEIYIHNQAGTVLPVTGGIGTTMIYIIGGILALAAVILLIAKRRMNTAE